MPYMDPSVLGVFPFKEGDIVVTVPVKCGTNWTMFLVYSILTGGDISFTDLYERVPWIEFKFNQTQSIEDRIKFLEGVNYNTKNHRTFKSHIPITPGPLPFLPQVQYVVTCRNPYDMLLSLAPFFKSHTDEFFEAWGMKNFKQNFEDPNVVFNLVASGDFPPSFVESYVYAWELRHKPNVLLVHFSDLKKDLPGQVDRLAKFLKKDLSAEEREKVIKHCDFKWMKDHEEMFNISSIGYKKENGLVIQPLQPKALMRKGLVGEHEHVLTQDQKQKIFDMVRKKVSDDRLLKWIFEGGILE